MVKSPFTLFLTIKCSNRSAGPAFIPFHVFYAEEEFDLSADPAMSQICERRQPLQRPSLVRFLKNNEVFVFKSGIKIQVKSVQKGE